MKVIVLKTIFFVYHNSTNFMQHVVEVMEKRLGNNKTSYEEMSRKEMRIDWKNMSWVVNGSKQWGKRWMKWRRGNWNDGYPGPVLICSQWEYHNTHPCMGYGTAQLNVGQLKQFKRSPNDSLHLVYLVAMVMWPDPFCLAKQNIVTGCLFLTQIVTNACEPSA